MSAGRPQDFRLILASRSAYRQELLTRLGLEFECIPADIDESRRTNELPKEYVRRLAQEKAAKIATSHPQALVIGSDQCAVVDGQIMGKPGDREGAIRQLKTLSGNEIIFLTGLCLTQISSGWSQHCVEPFSVGFRQLTSDEIERYVDAEQPFDCAGSFKSEGYGVSLCRFMRGEDPSALIGLPLIRVSQYLREFGVALP